jgi:Uma2 family endonuclease
MSRTALTYADYAALPDDGRRYELHGGELSVTPAPGTRHQTVTLNLAVVLRDHVRTRSLGIVFIAPIDCILDAVTVVQPDVVFVASEHAARVSERGIEGSPTLAVEVLSASTERIDRIGKLALYARYRVEHYWIVDPVAQTIGAYSLVADELRVSASLQGASPASLPPFPDLVIDPAVIWNIS